MGEDEATDLSFLEGDDVSPLVKLLRDDEAREPASAAKRLVLLPTKTERALLENLQELMGYPSAKPVIFDALREMKGSIESSGLSLGSMTRLESRLDRLLKANEDDQLMLQRLLLLVNAYQRSFLAFTILHDSKVSLDAPKVERPAPAPVPFVAPASAVTGLAGAEAGEVRV